MGEKWMRNILCGILLAGLTGGLCGCTAGDSSAARVQGAADIREDAGLTDGSSTGNVPFTDGGSGAAVPEAGNGSGTAVPEAGNGRGTAVPEAGNGSDVAVPEAGNGSDAAVPEAGNGSSAAALEAGNERGIALPEVGNGSGAGVQKAGNGSDIGGQMASGGDTAAAAQAADGAAVVTDFGLRLLRHCAEAAAVFPPNASMPMDVYLETGSSANILVSPLSVMTALAMTAGGAEGETLAQMEEVFGMSVPELSAYLSDYQERFEEGEGEGEAEKGKLNMANGIWFTEDERFTVEQAFLEKNEELFGAGLRRVPFDSSALEEINGWVKENTDGMIEEILDEIPGDAVMYLVNALAFEAQWQEIYHDYQVREGIFTKTDGTGQNVDMMYSSEMWYLEDALGEGFIKEYAGGKYAFAALLPREGMTVQEYVAALDGAKLREILANPLEVQVEAGIPKYKSEYSITMNKVLQEMGMADAFDSNRADFSGIGYSWSGNIYIGRVLHKTFIAVDESGTKAGAATAVEMKDGCAMLEPPQVRTVYLDRPFVYMILDREENVPVFLGIVEEVN